MTGRAAAGVFALALSLAPAHAEDDASTGERNLDIPSTDVNFGNKASTVEGVPQTGPILHRKFARKWRTDAETNLGRANAVIALAESGSCGVQAKSRASGWQQVLESARAEAQKGESKWETVPQISARYYMRAAKMADDLIAGAGAMGCRPAQ